MGSHTRVDPDAKEDLVRGLDTSEQLPRPSITASPHFAPDAHLL